MAKMNLVREFTKGIIKENPVLCLVLGTCPTLAVTTAASNAIGMGIAATIVLVCSNAVISLLRKIIPDKVRIPAYITIIAGFVTMVQMLVKAYAPDIDKALGIYLPLDRGKLHYSGPGGNVRQQAQCSSLCLGRLGMGVGFTAAMLAMGIIREFFGTGAVFGVPIFQGVIDPIIVFILPPGGFFVFGMLIALANKLSGSKKKPEEIGCAACPMNGTCSKLQEKEACDK